MRPGEKRELQKIIHRIYQQASATGFVGTEYKAEMLVIQNLCNKAYKIIAKHESPSESFPPKEKREAFPGSYYQGGDLEC